MSPLPNYEALGFKTLLVKLEGSIAIVTLNRAKQLNTVSKDLAADLVKAFEYFDKDDRVRVVILTAEPTSPAYCAGADITNGWDALWHPDEKKEGEQSHRDTGGAVALPIFRCRKITIAAVNGHAAGFGVSGLQLPFDFRLVWAGAKITMPFVRIGIAPEAVASYLLPRLIGYSKASAVLLSASTLSPSSPLISDLYYAILPKREDVLPAALKLAIDLSRNTSQTAIAITKGLIWRGADNIEEQHLLESRAIKILGTSADAAEGAAAFKERRPVNFQDTLSNISNWMPWWREIDVKHRKTKL